MTDTRSEHAGYAPYRDAEHPPYFAEQYRSTDLRAPRRPFFAPPRTISELTGPVFSQNDVQPDESDLAHLPDGRQATGQLMILAGRVLDEAGRPIPDTLIEIWQTNAAGKYNHPDDRFDAPLDPGFSGCGRCVTDAEGRYRFVTIRPGAYPWRNHYNAWRPAHIHFSLFGRAFATRLVTQMYFPGDPPLPLDPILASIPDGQSRERLVSAFDLDTTVPEVALGYRFDIVLRGRDATPLDP